MFITVAYIHSTYTLGKTLKHNLHTSIHIHICYDVTHLITRINVELALGPGHDLTLHVLNNANKSIHNPLDALTLCMHEP